MNDFMIPAMERIMDDKLQNYPTHDEMEKMFDRKLEEKQEIKISHIEQRIDVLESQKN